MRLSGTRSTRSATARIARLATVLVGTAAIGVITACSSDRLTGPAPVAPASAGLIGNVLDLVKGILTPVTGLLRTSSLSSSITRSITVNKNGGELIIPETGLTLTIPKNAVSSTVTIKVTAVAGNMIAYNFEPHGIKFATPITFSQDLSKTAFNGKNPKNLQGGYFKVLEQLNLLRGLGLVDEQLPARVSNNRVSFDISHFSGYMVSTGRASAADVDVDF